MSDKGIQGVPWLFGGWPFFDVVDFIAELTVTVVEEHLQDKAESSNH